MKKRPNQRYVGALLSFMSVLLVFSIAANIFLVTQQRKELLNQARQNAHSELSLAAAFVREALIKRDYQTVEQFLKQWALERQDIVELKATSPNQFLLAHYTRAQATDHPFSVTYPVNYEGRHLLTLELIKDFSSIEQRLVWLRTNLIAGSAVFVMALGLFLWTTVQRLALIPLERTEAELSRHRDHLENLVQARTADLMVANQQLQQEISERRQAEEALVQAQKMEVVGQLTGGIAHDFNNLLTVIGGNLQLLEYLSGNDPSPLKLIQEASKATTRGAELVQKLLAFSRRQALHPRKVDLNRLTADMIELLQRTLGEKIEIEAAYSESLWKAQVDPGQAEIALLNLALNARDAMPDGGKLVIELGNTWLDQDYAACHADVRPGDYVKLAVSDTGTGMPPEVAEHAFEPFFTTKALGKGSGLGLSMVYGFAKQSAGHIKIDSKPGHGTTVKLYLPRATEEPAAVFPAQANPA